MSGRENPTKATAVRQTVERPNVALLFVLALVVPAIMIGLLLIQGEEMPPDSAPRPADERSDVQGAVDGLAEAVFGAYSEADRAGARTLEGYRRFLDDAGLSNGRTLRLESDRPFGGSGDLEPRLAAVRAALERRLAEAEARRDRELRLRAFTVARDDGWEDTVLRIHAELSDSDDFGRARIYERAYQVTGRPFDGFGFALLANNVNCILCHASFDNAARVHNTDARARGTFARVRVGALESLHFREASACSRIAGSLYVRGSVTRKDGAPLTDLAATTISTVRFDEDGFLAEDDFKNLLGRPFEKALGDPPAARATLYVDYPGTPEHQTDGPMPSSFPPPIPDLDGDRSVDGEEFLIVAATENGRIDGGMKTLVPPGAVFDRPTIEWNGDFEASGVVSGNLVARGTLASPLRVDGRVAIDGDLVIEGVVRGSGIIFVRGNIYVTGPLIYADRRDAAYNRIFGTAHDGKPNRLALAAGGSVLIGNILDKSEAQGVAARVTGDTRGCMNFTISESMLFNRMEWTRTQAALPGERGSLVENPLYVPGYRPRYYTLFAGSPVYVMNDGSKVELYFDPVSRSWRGFEAAFFWSSGGWTEYPAGDPELAGSRLLSLMPERWMSGETLESLWSDAASRHTPGEAFEVDGLLYTNNAVIFTAPKSSVYAASLLVNGAIVAADVGILAPGNGGVGMQLNYDARLDGLLTIRDVNDLTLVRGDRPFRFKRR